MRRPSRSSRWSAATARAASAWAGWGPSSRPTSSSWLGGEDALTSYHFNTHNIDHLFCRKCGIESFASGRRPDGSPTVAINARCLEGVEPDELTVTKFNGRAR